VTKQGKAIIGVWEYARWCEFS